MASGVGGYLHGARAQATEARVEARPEGLRGGYPAVLYKGKILAEQDGGTYQVGVLDDATGAVSATLNGITGFPDAAFTVGQQVWLVQREGCPLPGILTGAGSGEGGVCANYEDWGALTT